MHPQSDGAHFNGYIARIDNVLLKTLPQCWYCGRVFSPTDEKCIVLEVPHAVARFHFGTCWNYFVIGVHLVNQRQTEMELQVRN